MNWSSFMPQVLKEDVRNRIIESAKKEFMQKGYEKTNMRSIAHNCSMTVGNVYRYFKNKEELSKYIVSNVVDKIDIMVKELTDNEIELLNDSFSLLPSKTELKKLVAKLSDKLAEIYYLMPDEFNILILGSEYSEKIEQWFMKLVKFFTYKMLPELSDCENEVLSSAFSVSIVKGISRIMYRNNLTIDELKRVLIIYINNYIDGFVEKR